MEDRQLLDRELRRYTAGGWQIVSQTEHGFQVMAPHTVSGVAVFFLVVMPMMLGIFAALFSVPIGSGLLSLVLVFAALLALNHLTVRPKLLYISADQLRTPASIIRNADGVSMCSACWTPTRTEAGKCPNCSVEFGKA